MSFNVLPTEIIYEISQRIQPDDLESYGRTNHRINSIAAPFLHEHRQLRVQYSKVSLDDLTAARMVYEMSARPWIRLYPRCLEVKVNRNSRTFQDYCRDRKKAVQVAEIVSARSKINEGDVRELLRRTGIIEVHKMDSWLEDVERGNEDSLFALLLACLPNLQRLVIRLDHTRLEQVKEMVRLIKQQSPLMGSPKALSRLIDVRVLEREGSDMCDLELFPLLASLPSVQILHGRNLVGRYRDCWRDGWLNYPGASEAITHINLETCGMSVEGLEMLCKSIKGLRSFKYVAHRAGWGLHRVSDMVNNAHSTLEELVLSTGSGQSRFIGPLRKFTALKDLTVDSGMMIHREKMMRAVDVLPASIETVLLSGNGLTHAAEEQFLADLNRVSFHYPKLSQLMVDDSYGKRPIGQERLKFRREFYRQSSLSSQPWRPQSTTPHPLPTPQRLKPHTPDHDTRPSSKTKKPSRLKKVLRSSNSHNSSSPPKLGARTGS